MKVESTLGRTPACRWPLWPFGAERCWLSVVAPQEWPGQDCWPRAPVESQDMPVPVLAGEAETRSAIKTATNIALPSISGPPVQ